VKITQAGVDAVAAHLAQFGYWGPNEAMISRLSDQMGSVVTGADADFYTHELLESQ